MNGPNYTLENRNKKQGGGGGRRDKGENNVNGPLQKDKRSTLCPTWGKKDWQRQCLFEKKTMCLVMFMGWEKVSVGGPKKTSRRMWKGTGGAVLTRVEC